MKEYYFDSNAKATDPQILYQQENEVGGDEALRLEACWEEMQQNADQPLEKLILDITYQQSEWLKEKIEQARGKAGVSSEWAGALLLKFYDYSYALVEQMLTDGVPDVSVLKALLKNYRNECDDMYQYDDKLLAPLIIEEDRAALTEVKEMLHQNIATKKIIQLINETQLNRFFTGSHDRLPDNFNRTTLNDAINNILPGRLATTDFLDAFLNNFTQRVQAAERHLSAEAFKRPETYQRFPGVVIEKCWLEDGEFAKVDIQEYFNPATLNHHLKTHPNGYITRGTGRYAPRVILPAHRRVKTHAGAELFRGTPETADITEIFTQPGLKNKLVFFINLFEEYLRPQIEQAGTKAGAQRKICIWLVLCQEGLEEIIPNNQPGVVETGFIADLRLRDEINKIINYLERAQKQLPAKIYNDTKLQRLGTRRQQNIAKCLQLNEELAQELKTAQTQARGSIKPTQRKSQILTDLLTRQEQIRQEIQEYKKSLQNTGSREAD